MDATQVMVITVVGQLGALVGRTSVGFCSTFTGRRLAMIVACVFGGAFVPAYVIPRHESLIAASFLQQVFVGRVWGPITVHLIELSPSAMRTFFYGVTYQLGNLAFSTSATIEAVIGESFPLAPIDGEERNNYGKVIGKPPTSLRLHHLIHKSRNLPRRRMGVYSDIYLPRARNDAIRERRRSCSSTRVREYACPRHQVGGNRSGQYSDRKARWGDCGSPH